MSVEVVRAREEFQRFLDEAFPEGGRVSRISEVGGRMLPAMDILCSRLFVSDAALGADGEWIYEITVDPNPPLTHPMDAGRPWQVWIEGLFLDDSVEHVLWEAQVVTSAGDELPELMRVVPGLSHLTLVDAEGQVTSPERMREWTSDLWMPVLFPQGLEVA